MVMVVRYARTAGGGGGEGAAGGLWVGEDVGVDIAVGVGGRVAVIGGEGRRVGVAVGRGVGAGRMKEGLGAVVVVAVGRLAGRVKAVGVGMCAPAQDAQNISSTINITKTGEAEGFTVSSQMPMAVGQRVGCYTWNNSWRAS